MGKAFSTDFIQSDDRRLAINPVPPAYLGSVPIRPRGLDDDLAIPSGVTARLLEMICKLRQQRHEFLPARLRNDCAWQILLQLYSAHVAQRRVSIGGVTAATGLTNTSALRWLRNLEAEGFVSRLDDPLDSRRVFVSLAPTGVLAMNRYFARTGSWTIFL